MTDLKHIIALAEAATPGPWKQHLVDETTIVSETAIEIGTTCDSSQAERDDGYNVEYERMEADAAFIAAANPAVVKAMAERLIEAAEVIQAFACDNYDCNAFYCEKANGENPYCQHLAARRWRFAPLI